MKLATCHPERKHQARGLCKPCYDKWLKENNPEYRRKQLENTKRWYEENPNAYAALKVKNHEKWEKRKADPNHKRKRRDAMLRKKYGIGADGYDRILEQQGGGCAICGRRPGATPLHVDHDHDTGEVRGILCHQCNWYLGTIDANPEIIGRIIRYRSKEKGDHVTEAVESEGRDRHDEIAA